MAFKVDGAKLVLTPTTRGTSQFEQLPKDIHTQFLRYFDLVTIARYSRLCKTCYILSQSSSIWTQKLLQRFPKCGWETVPAGQRKHLYIRELLRAQVNKSKIPIEEDPRIELKRAEIEDIRHQIDILANRIESLNGEIDAILNENINKRHQRLNIIERLRGWLRIQNVDIRKRPSEKK